MMRAAIYFEVLGFAFCSSLGLSACSGLARLNLLARRISAGTSAETRKKRWQSVAGGAVNGSAREQVRASGE